MIVRALFVILLLVIAAPVVAQDRGTAEEAQAMVARAIELYEKVGMGETLRQITLSPKPDFQDRDLYVFVIDSSGTIAAHARYPQSVGRNGLGAVDSEGTFYMREILARASPQGAWVDYNFVDPQTGEPAPKSTWVVSHDMFIFACGIYAGDIGI